MSMIKFFTPLCIASLCACSTIPPDRDLGQVRELLQQRGGEPFAEIRPPHDENSDPTESLRNGPLSETGALQIALRNNPRLKSAYADLGIAAADVYDATRLSNPRFSLAILDSSARGAANQINLGLAQNIADLILLKTKTQQAHALAQQAKLSVAAKLFAFGQDVREAYYRFLAAQQRAVVKELSAQAIALSTELSRRYYESGNVNQLEVSLAEAALSEAELDTATARADERGARITLNRLLGLHGDNPWHAPPGLPLPVATEDELAPLLHLAQENRLDLKAAIAGVELSTSVSVMTRRFRYLGDIQAGVEYEHETSHSRLLGPSFAIEIPIFNQGDGRVMRAQATLERQQARLESLRLTIANAVALAHNRMLTAKERSDIYRSRFLPSRRDVVARTQELQNYMLASPFDALSAKRSEFEALGGYVQALGDYWLARIDLERAIGTTLPSATDDTLDRVDAQSLLAPPPTSDHEHHQSHKHDANHGSAVQP